MVEGGGGDYFGMKSDLIGFSLICRKYMCGYHVVVISPLTPLYLQNQPNTRPQENSPKKQKT